MSGCKGQKAKGERLMGSFKELRVWQKGKDLAVYIYQITSYSKRNF
jgi:hypothetical protein